jgi:hypothetical protein
MYEIKLTEYGYHLTFGDTIEVAEMSEWVEKSRLVLNQSAIRFGVFVDMRTLNPISPEAQEQMEIGQKLYLESGMERSVVIVSNEALKEQFIRIAWHTGIYKWERYINSEVTNGWEDIGLDWIENKIDPDPVADPKFIDSLLKDAHSES